MRLVADHLDYGLSLVFVGFNPSLRSSETGHHYANPNNRFYRILYGSGLTPRLYAPAEGGELMKLGYGFTNIVARPTRAADEITPAEYAEERVILRQKLERYRPRFVCFVGKGVYEQYSGRRAGVGWGLQDEPVVSGMNEFVAPSSSGLVRMSLEEVTAIYSRLRELLSAE